MKVRICLVMAAVFAPCLAWGQSNPGFVSGFIPSAEQWNGYFAAKEDAFNAVGILKGVGAGAPVSATAGTDFLSPSGLGSGVQNALEVNVGLSGALVVNGGPLGTPSGGTMTNTTGTPSGTLSGNALASNVTTSSLTSIGTLVSGAIPASLIVAGTFPGAFTFSGNLTTGAQLSANGGIFQSGAPPLSGTFYGGNFAAMFGYNQTYAAASATVPEIGAQFYMTDSVGYANPGTAFKVALFSAVYGSVGHSAIYAWNGNVQGYAGTSTSSGLYGNESDVNNFGNPAETLGAVNGAYGYMALTGGSAISTVGFRAAAAIAAAGWYWGHSCDGYVVQTCFYDHTGQSGATGSIHVMLADGSHQAGIDFSGATFLSGASFIGPNGTAYTELDTGGTVRNGMALTTSNVWTFGDAVHGVNLAGASLSINGTAAVSCSGVPTSSAVWTNGLRTAC